MNPAHHDYCNCVCPEGLSFEKLQETLNRVRIMHVLINAGVSMAFCGECEVDYPCPTIQALEGR